MIFYFREAVSPGRTDLDLTVLSGRADLDLTVLSGRTDLDLTVLSGRNACRTVDVTGSF